MEGVREVPVPLGVRQATAEGESRASDDFRTAMGAMEVGEDAMEKGGRRLGSESMRYSVRGTRVIPYRTIERG